MGHVLRYDDLLGLHTIIEGRMKRKEKITEATQSDGRLCGYAALASS